MKMIAIICEYNPFHKGHEYQIKEIRRKFPSDALIGVMSGAMTERGEPAIMSKYARAEAAVKCGLDLVVELPAPWSMSGAAFFAAAGVRIAAAVGADTLAFGSECGSVGELREIAEYLSSDDFLKASAAARAENPHLQTGDIRANVLRERFGCFPTGSNDILAIEYIRAAERLGAKLDCITIKREGGAYNCETPTGVKKTPNCGKATVADETLNRGKAIGADETPNHGKAIGAVETLNHGNATAADGTLNRGKAIGAVETLNHGNATVADETPNRGKAIGAVETLNRSNSTGGKPSSSEKNFSSASAVRQTLFSGGDASTELPEASYEILTREKIAGRLCLKPLDEAVSAFLRLSPESMRGRLEVSGGIENRLHEAAKKNRTIDLILDAATERRYSKSRLRRAIFGSMLGYTMHDAEEKPEYTVLLAANGVGRRIIESSAIPVLTRPSDFKKLEKKARAQFERAVKAEYLQELSAYSPMNIWSSRPFILQ